MQYLSVLHKWESMKHGQLAQRLPSFVPGRQYLSRSRANNLNLPFDKKEALKKFNVLESALKQEWLGKSEFHKNQKDLVMELLILGAHSLPYTVLHSEWTDLHLRDFLKKDLEKSVNDLKKGNDIFLKYRTISNYNF